MSIVPAHAGTRDTHARPPEGEGPSLAVSSGPSASGPDQPLESLFSRAGPPQMRPLLWRLPLVLFLLAGIATLIYVDRIIRRDYRSEAAAQALQTDALLESFVRHRLFVLGTLQALITATPSRAEERERLAIFSREIVANAPDIAAIALLDERGRLRESWHRGSIPVRDPASTSVRRLVALERARSERRPTLSGTVNLDKGGLGVIAYIPLVRDDQVNGFLAAHIPYQALFDDALAGQLQGAFAYRIIDESGEPIAVSPDFPRQPAHVLRRDVTAPADLDWTLEVAISAFEPRIPRVVNLVVGPMLLLLVLFLVLREEARARRFGEHSLDLEIVSSNLLAANARLEERARVIAETNAAKSRFLANVSHELRTPINAIVGYNSLALEDVYGPLPPGLRTAHQRIQAAADHLLRLVEDVLDLSKIEVGRLALDVETVDLGALLEGIVTVMQPLADAKRLELTASVEPDLPTITSDPSRIRQIVLNLASNAIKFTERGSVTLSVFRDRHDPEHRVQIEVRDTGIGIPRRDQGRIFEEFEQIRPTGRGDSLQRGAGLGLAISRKLARVLGGELRAYSRVRRGSIFTLELPLTAPDVTMSTPADGHDAIATPADEEASRPVLRDDAAAADTGDEGDVLESERLDHPSARG